MTDNWTITCIVFLFMVYPSVCRMLFELFACKTLGNQRNYLLVRLL